MTNILPRDIPYSVSSLDLSTPRTDFAMGKTNKANTLTVLTSHAAGTASFKINSPNNTSIPASIGLQVNVNEIDEVLVTNISGIGSFQIFTSYVY